MMTQWTLRSSAVSAMTLDKPDKSHELQQPYTISLTLGAHTSKGLQAAPGTGSLLAPE